MKISIVACALFGAFIAGNVSAAEGPELSTNIESVDAISNVVMSVNGDIDLRCTLSCSFWNWCRFKNISNPSVCGPEPEGCQCTSF